VQKIKSYGIFENIQELSPKEKEQFELIMKAPVQWRNFYLELTEQKKANYLKHFQIEKFAQKKTSDILYLLRPLESDKFLKTWVEERKDRLPKDFLEIFGVSQDLKELGF
jgi:hypothetical protein